MPLVNTDSHHQLTGQVTEIMFIEDDDELQSENEYEK
jgi:hypothetical protein